MSFWDTPKGLWLILGVTVAAASVVGFMFGQEVAKRLNQPQTVIVRLEAPPGTTSVTLTPAQPTR